MSVALKAVAWAWSFKVTENDSPVHRTPRSHDSLVHKTILDFQRVKFFESLVPRTLRCLGHRGVLTLQYIGHRGVTTAQYIGPFWIFSGSNFSTLRCIGPREVSTLRYIGHRGVMWSCFKIQITISPKPSWCKMRKNFCRLTKFFLILICKI